MSKYMMSLASSVDCKTWSFSCSIIMVDVDRESIGSSKVFNHCNVSTLISVA